ncbi:MAG: DUF3857 domain-containing protein [Myxococcales bacterium]|nr:DUF3857 domain-containing protein [Myxococcales bacterium]
MRTPRTLAPLLALLSACAGPQPRPPAVPAAPAPVARSLPESARPWAAWLERCDLDEAERDLQEHLSRLPEQARLERQRTLLGLGLLHLSRGRFGEDARMFWQAVQAEPGSRVALLAAWQLDESLAVSGPASHGIRSEVESLLRSPLSPELRFLLHRVLRSLALREGDWDTVEAHVRQAGAIPTWRIWPLTGRDPQVALEEAFRQFPGAFPAQPGRAHPSSSADGLLLYEEEGARGLLLAECLFEIKSAATLWLRLEGDGTWAAAFDEQALLHDRRPGHAGVVETRLFTAQPGRHRLRVAVPIEGGRAILGVNLLPADAAAPDLVFLSQETGAAPPLANSAPSQGAEPQAEAIREADRAPEDPLPRLWAALASWSYGDMDQAIEQLMLARQRAPAFSLVDYLEGVLWLENDDLPQGIGAAQARRLWGQALATCPGLDLVRFRLALLDGMENREEQALETLQRLEALHPQTFIFPFFMANFFDRLGWNAEADQALERARRRVDFDPELWRLLFSKALRWRDEQGAYRLAQELVRRNQLISPLNAFFWARGERETTRRGLEAAARYFGAQLGARLEAVDLELAAGELERARAALDRAEADFGLRPELVKRRVDLLERQNREREAVRWLERLSQLWPWDLHLRLALRVVDGRDRMFSAADGPADPLSIIREYLESDFVAGGDAVLVLDQADLDVAPDGSSVERIHFLVHLLSAAGVERWGEVRDIPPGAQVEMVRSLDASGNSREAEVVPGKESITIPALQTGDFVEIAYRVGRRPSGVRAGGFSASRFYFASEGLPIFRSRYTVRVPKGLPLVIRQHNGAPAPSRQRVGAFDVYRIERTRTPALPAEPDAAPLDESAPFVEVGFANGWRDLRDLLSVRLARASRISWPVIHFVQQHTPRLWSDAELACSLFREVNRAVRRGSDAGDFDESAASVLMRGEGNRLIALVAVLRAAGFDPAVYLARTISSPVLEYRFPQDGVFTHGVVAVPLSGGKTLWLDPAERDQPCGRLFSFLWDQPALRLTGSPGDDFLTRLPPAPERLPGKEIRLELELGADGTLSGTGRDVLDTAEATRARELLSGFSSALRQQVMENGLSAAFPGARLESWSMEALDDPERPLVLHYRLRTSGMADLEPDGLVLRGGFFPYRLAAGLAAQARRARPLLIEDETRLRTTVEIRLPPGATAELPAEVRLEGPLSEFAYRARSENGRLILEKNIRVRAGRVAPEEFQAFKEFCLKVDRKDVEPIRVVMPRSVRAAAR